MASGSRRIRTENTKAEQETAARKQRHDDWASGAVRGNNLPRKHAQKILQTNKCKVSGQHNNCCAEDQPHRRRDLNVIWKGRHFVLQRPADQWRLKAARCIGLLAAPQIASSNRSILQATKLTKYPLRD